MARVLVIDDSRFTRVLSVAALAGAGHDVLQAASAAEALDVLSAGDLHCVVTDLYMPGLCGVEFLRCLRMRLPNTPIIVLSAEVEALETSDCAELDVQIGLAKPLQPPQLIAAVEQVLAPLKSV